MGRTRALACRSMRPRVQPRRADIEATPESSARAPKITRGARAPPSAWGENTRKKCPFMGNQCVAVFALAATFYPETKKESVTYENEQTSADAKTRPHQQTSSRRV